MDVKLPNGKIITGIPDGTSKEQVMQKAISAGLASEQDFGMQQAPTTDMPEIGDAPELNELSWGAFKTSLGLLATGDTDKSKQIIKENIPEAQFSQDAEGYEIINLPSGSYYLNRPGISGQDIAKGVFDIAAFTPAGRAATVGRAALGAGATEAGLQALSAGTGAEFEAGETLTESAISAATGGAFKKLEDAIGAGYRLVKGRLLPPSQAEEVAEFATKQDLPLYTTDIAEPKTFAGRSAQAAAEKIPVVGTGAQRAAQQEAREGVVSEFSKKFGEYKPEDVYKSLEGSASRLKQAAGRARQNVVDQIADTPISSGNTIKAIDDEIARLTTSPTGAERKTVDSKTVEMLQRYKDDILSDDSFLNLEQLRTNFRTDVKGERTVINNRSQAAINKIYSAMTKDMDGAVSANLGDDIAKKWKRSNMVYGEEAANIAKTRLKNVLNKGELTPESVNNLLFSQNKSDIKRLYNALSQKGKSAARAGIVAKAIDASGGSPDRFLNNMNKLSKQTDIFFKGQDKAYIDGLKKYLDTTREAGRAGVTTKTGQEAIQIGAPAAIATDFTTTGGLSTLGVGSFGVMARIYESKPVRNAILRLNRVKKGSTEFEKALTEAQAAINAVAQSDIRREE